MASGHIGGAAAPNITVISTGLPPGNCWASAGAAAAPTAAPRPPRCNLCHDRTHLYPPPRLNRHRSSLCRHKTSWQRLVCLSARSQKWNSIAHDARYLFCLRGMKVTTRGAPAITHDRAAVSESWRSVQQCDKCRAMRSDKRRQSGNVVMLG
jgi:hypothetical protein